MLWAIKICNLALCTVIKKGKVKTPLPLNGRCILTVYVNGIAPEAVDYTCINKLDVYPFWKSFVDVQLPIII